MQNLLSHSDLSQEQYYLCHYVVTHLIFKYSITFHSILQKQGEREGHHLLTAQYPNLKPLKLSSIYIPTNQRRRITEQKCTFSAQHFHFIYGEIRTKEIRPDFTTTNSIVDRTNTLLIPHLQDLRGKYLNSFVQNHTNLVPLLFRESFLLSFKRTLSARRKVAPPLSRQPSTFLIPHLCRNI